MKKKPIHLNMTRQTDEKAEEKAQEKDVEEKLLVLIFRNPMKTQN